MTSNTNLKGVNRKTTNNSISVDSVSESPDSPRFATKEELANRLKGKTEVNLENDI